MGQPPGVAADEALVDPRLGLVAQVVVDARDDDDQAIAGIRRLADQSGVVRGLAALDMAHDHAAAAPRAQVARIAQPVQHPIRHLVRRVDH